MAAFLDNLRRVYSFAELQEHFFGEVEAGAHCADGASLVAQKRCRNGSARRVPVSKKDAPWQRMLDGCINMVNTIQDEQSRDGRYFRRRFRMPYILFQALIKLILDEQWFTGFGADGRGRKDCTGNLGASLHVKVLSVLRVLGRGVTFDECYDGSGCGEESTRSFFHLFVAQFAQRLYPHVCNPPRSVEDITLATSSYELLGLGCAIGSTDCTHILLGNCPHKFRICCTGKEGSPTLAYSLTCSHQRKIYHCSPGFFGAKNDKYISKLDSFISAVGQESIYTNFEWKMDVTDTATVQRKGVYLICDGGYHKWPHMICGLKVCSALVHLLHFYSVKLTHTCSTLLNNGIRFGLFKWSQCARMWNALLEF
jgi:hypothetical protein